MQALFRHVMALFIAVAAVDTAAQITDPLEQRIISWVDANSDDAIELLAKTVNISSGTMNHAGVRAVGDVMRAEFDALGMETTWIDMPEELNRAGHLFARKGGNSKKFLLIGHLDTVFEADDAFQQFTRNGNSATGPGIADMKSGNVILLFALKALAAVGALDSLAITVALTGDEEATGKPLAISRKDLIEAGQWADIAFGFENSIHAEGSDWATIARRSSSNWTLETTGKQAHSSAIFSDGVGAGAINEAARILSRFYGEIRGEYGLTFNAGNIQGGTSVIYDPQAKRGSTFGKTNVVPSTVIVDGGVRTISNEQLERTRARMQAIVEDHLPGTSATLSLVASYPAMPPTEGNRALAEQLSSINVALGRGPMKIWDPLKRGAADIAFVAPYTDALAGLGALGAGSHTPHESLELDSMALAIKRAALLMLRTAH
jgi:glutamate carboxypeptidase